MHLIKIKKNIETIFICVCICYLPVANIIKSILNAFDISIIVSPFIILRFLFFLMCLYIFLTTKKKLNKINLLILAIFVIFFINIFFENTPSLNKFYVPKKIESITPELLIQHYNNKSKNLLLIFLNLLPVILIFTFCEFNFDLKKAKKLLRISFDKILILIIFFYLVVIFQKLATSEGYFLNNVHNHRFFDLFIVNESAVINSHFISLSFVIYFILIFDEYKKNDFKNIFFYKTFFLIILSVIFQSKIFFIILLILLFYFFLEKNSNNKYFLFLLLFLPLTTFFLFWKLTVFYSFDELYNFNQSVFWRSVIAEFYFNNFSKFNFLFGNSIYEKNIYTYAHNFLFDVYFASGITGLIIFIYFIFKSFRVFKLDNFIIYLNISLIIFSTFSGYFFYNNLLITCLMLLNICKLKTEEIKK